MDKPDGEAGPAPGRLAAYAWSSRQTGSLEALRDVVEAGGRVRRSLARDAGLSDTELVAIQHLVAEPLGPGEVARRLELTPAAATGIVDRLVARGHLERRPQPGDRRRTALHVTPSGRDEVLAHLRPMLTGLAEVDRGFDEAERAVVERYLRAAARVLHDTADGVIPE